MKGSRLDRDALLVSAALIFQVLFFLPLDIFLNNVIEFNVGPHSIAAVFLGASVVSLAALYPVARWKPLRALALLLAAGIFVESRLLFGVAGHQPFDGKLIDWPALHPWSVIELWILLAAALAGTILLIRLGVDKVAQPAALFILVFQGAGLAAGAASNFDQLAAMARLQWASSPYYSQFHRLSRKRNVVQIVADHTQGSLVYEILTGDLQRYSKTLEGFTLFTQASGKYPGTYPAIPHLMTGLGPEVGDRIVDSVPLTHESIRRNLRERSIVTVLKENDFAAFGYQVSALFCEGPYDACISGDVFSGQPMFTRWERLARDCLKTMDVALFRMSPTAVRPCVYNDEQWLMRAWAVKERTPSGVLDLFIDQLAADGREGSYNYFHHQGGHPPIQFDADCRFLETQEWRHDPTKAQVACGLRQLERLAAALKAKGLFDQTLIVMQGDHGSQWRTPLMKWRSGSVAAPRIISSANPLLLIKPPGARQPLHFSDAPAEIGDAPATIAGAFGLGHEFPGKSVVELEEDEQRERVYLWFKPDPGIFQNQALPRTSPYRIRGNLFNQYDWIPPYLNEVSGAPTRMRVDDPRFEEFSQGFSGLGDAGRTRRLEGTLARAYLSAPGRKVSLVLRCGLPPTMTDQELKILVNGAETARLTDADLSGPVRSVRLPLPSNMALKPVNVVELKARETVKPEGDRRLVSLLVEYIGFE